MCELVQLALIVLNEFRFKLLNILLYVDVNNSTKYFQKLLHLKANR